MKQLIQYFKTGELEIIDVPVPTAGNSNLIVETSNSLISLGTERMLLDFGKASLVQKARKQPEKVKMVLEKIKTDGIIATTQTVMAKLNDPTPIGYSNVGRIVEVGKNVEKFKINDRVVSNGPHAEYVKVPWTLAAKIPDGVSNEEASFAILGSIALEGIRLAKPTIGENFVIVGLGLIGQLTAQLLRANGCNVIGFDIDPFKINLLNELGMKGIISNEKENNINTILNETNGIGADGVIITASTADSDLINEIGKYTRKRGRIILVGVAPINIDRNVFYEKEILFQVSAAYGPGRYDPNYEDKGNDYPLAYVRWTAGRNMVAFLMLLDKKLINVSRLITHHFKFDDISSAYNLNDRENPIGIIVNYDEKKVYSKNILNKSGEANINNVRETPVIGFIGTGNFSKLVLLPYLHKLGAKIKAVSSTDGLNAGILSKKHLIPHSTSNSNDIFEDNEINTVFIANRHSNHSSLTLNAIKHKKHMFIEKPLALNLVELEKIIKSYQSHENLRLMVGFNRRFAPFVKKIKSRIGMRTNPISIVYTINAGPIPANHWIHDLDVGGGRIIGEACHFVDLCRFFVGFPITEVAAITTEGYSGTDDDKVMILLKFKDGSNAAIHYLANGNKKYPKEKIEIFSSEKIYTINNFLKLDSYGDNLSKRMMKQDKGHKQELIEFLESISSEKNSPIPFEEIIEVHLATFAIIESMKTKKIISIATQLDKLKN